MATRSVIARAHGDDFVGRYHHSDGYPSGVGETLYTIYGTVFSQDTQAMLKYLIDDHPAGWSSINGADFALEPGFGHTNAPRCYCHGERSEEEQTITSIDDCGAEWAYVINEKTHKMYILAEISWYPEYNGGIDTSSVPYDERVAHWLPITEIDLRNRSQAINWEAIDDWTTYLPTK